MLFNMFVRPDKHRMALWRLQCDTAHRLGLRLTQFLAPGQFGDEEVMALCREDSARYGDELGIWLTPDGGAHGSRIWLLRQEDKRRAVQKAVDAYERALGHPPASVGNYVMDAALIRIVHELAPSVTGCVAGCFEEGVKVYHGCNHSWYLFSEGMSWAPWYPSREHSLRPAADAEDWSGVVAVPHLCRDLVFGYESRNDFFASHPANVQRGLANEGLVHAYDFNLCDQYRMQEDFNAAPSYYQIHVSSGWLSGNPNILDTDEVTQQLYRETLEYIAALRDAGELVSMTLSEFAAEYRRTVPIGGQSVAVGKDILMDSGKQYFWAIDPGYRVLVDLFQGGSIGDLRPYAGRYAAFTGPDAPSGRYDMNSYPYLIQSQYRTGYKTHSRDGSRTTLLLSHGGEQRDLCAYNTRIASVERTEEGGSRLTLEPVTVAFSDGVSVTVQTVYDFRPGGRIGMTRRLLSAAPEDLRLTEYVKGCYGFTEYPEDMKTLRLCVDGTPQAPFDYDRTVIDAGGGSTVSVVIPPITTELALTGEGAAHMSVREGELFDPFYTLQAEFSAADRKEYVTWLSIRHAPV